MDNLSILYWKVLLKVLQHILSHRCATVNRNTLGPHSTFWLNLVSPHRIWSSRPILKNHQCQVTPQPFLAGISSLNSFTVYWKETKYKSHLFSSSLPTFSTFLFCCTFPLLPAMWIISSNVFFFFLPCYCRQLLSLPQILFFCFILHLLLQKGANLTIMKNRSLLCT